MEVVSYRPTARSPRGTSPEAARALLAKAPGAVLLLHGYNNGEKDARAAYDQFLRYQPEARAPVVGVLWPGDNWTGPLYYMQAIGVAERTAPLLAADLHAAAQRWPTYHLDIIAHSLGTRLALETVQRLLELLRARPVPGLRLGRLVLMAGAVPTAYLDATIDTPNTLADVLPRLEGVMSLYSEKDRVLQWAFPLGQSVVGERVLPVALGRRQWGGGNAVLPPLRQERNAGAGHSDYWGGSSRNKEQLRQAATFIKQFVPRLGQEPSRPTPTRLPLSREVEDSRVVGTS